MAIYIWHLSPYIYDTYIYMTLIWKLSEKGMAKAWSNWKVVRSAGFSTSFGCQRNPTKIPSHFILLKTRVNQRYYRDCVLLSYTKTEKWSYRRKRVINNKTEKNKITNKQVWTASEIEISVLVIVGLLELPKQH